MEMYEMLAIGKIVDTATAMGDAAAVFGTKAVCGAVGARVLVLSPLAAKAAFATVGDRQYRIAPHQTAADRQRIAAATAGTPTLEGAVVDAAFDPADAMLEKLKELREQALAQMRENRRFQQAFLGIMPSDQAGIERSKMTVGVDLAAPAPKPPRNPFTIIAPIDHRCGRWGQA